MRLAAEPTPTVLLHGDLTPVNVLDGGPERGLVAIDPAPCLGDPDFDAVDLVFWRADGHRDRSRPARSSLGRRLPAASLDWCIAFAGHGRARARRGARRHTRRKVEHLLELASRA